MGRVDRIDEGPGLLFRASYRKTHGLTERPLTTDAALRIVKRRARDARLPKGIGCHTFQATGIAAFLANGGELATAQRIAGLESPRTTKHYDRTQEEIRLDEIERVHI